MKGLFYTPILFLITFVALTTAFISFASVVPSQHLGTSQNEIISLYQEFQLKNIEESIFGRVRLTKFLYNLSNNGGYYTPSKCGNYYGLPLWSGKNIEDEYVECFPSLTEQVKEGLNDENYDYYVSLEPVLTVRAIAKNFTRIGDKRFYEDKLSYTIDVPYNVEAYNLIGTVIKKISEECQKEERNLERCVKKNIPKDFELINPEDLPNYEIKYEADHFIQSLIKSTTNSCSKDYYFDQPVFFDQKTLLNGEVNSYDLQMSFSKSIPPSSDSNQKEFALIKGQVFKENKNVFLTEEDKFFNNRPCLLDERVFIIHYQTKGYNLNKKFDYFVPIYIKDSIPPKYKKLEAEDLKFDEDNSLITWSFHPDVKEYVLDYGKKSITIKPWELNIQKSLGDCILKRTENNLVKCFYSFGILSSDVYYFYEDQEFAYKLPFDGEITLTAVDNDNNNFSRTVTSVIEDDLPIQSLSYVITPILIPSTTTYSSVKITLLSQPNLNLDGSDLKTVNSGLTIPEFLFFEDPSRELKRKDAVSSFGIVNLKNIYSITDSPKFLVLMDDPSLDNYFPSSIFQCFQMVGITGMLIPC